MPTAPAALGYQPPQGPGTVLDGASLGDAPLRGGSRPGLPLLGDHGAAGSASGLSPVQPPKPRKPETPPECFLLAHYYLLRSQTEKKQRRKSGKEPGMGKKGKGSGRKCRSAIEEAQKRLGELRKEERKNMACSVGNASKIYFSLPKEKKCTILSLCFVTTQKGKDYEKRK